MEGFVDEINQADTRVVLQEITVAVSVDSQSNIEYNDAWNLGILHRRTLRPRPRVTYADLSPVSRRIPSPQLPTGSFTFEPTELEDRTYPAEKDDQSNFNFETPPKTPRSTHKSPSKRPIDTPPSATDIPFTIHIDSPDESPMTISLEPREPVPAKRPRMLLLGDQASLGQQLASLTNEQLVEVVERHVEMYPDMHQEILDLLPEPDLSHCQERLSELLHNVFRALPRTRLVASTRGVLGYRQVKVHLLEFKKYCIQQGRHLVSCHAWGALINYVLLAWQLVNYLPMWEHPAHNNIRGQCLRSLVVFCSKALKSGDLGKDRMLQIRTRLIKACRLNTMMQSCLDLVHAYFDKDV